MNKEQATTAQITEQMKPIMDTLEKAGWTAKLHVFAARFDYKAGAHIHVSSHLREHWGCQLRVQCCWKTGKPERITVVARPARTVTIKHTDKSMPGLLERIAACFNADVEDEARRKQDHAQAEAWAIQALRDFRGVILPDWLIPGWCRDSDDANQRFSHLHRGMHRTPIGRYFPQIDTADLIRACGNTKEGMNAEQVKALITFVGEVLPSLADTDAPKTTKRETCCDNEQRSMAGGCTNCGDPSL